MNTIVMNTLTGAVSEYSGFDFHAITDTHAGSGVGLYAFGGSLDVTSPIVSSIVTGMTLLDAAERKMPSAIYFSMTGTGSGLGAVYTKDAVYTYEFAIRYNEVSRCTVGLGIRENYLAFGFANLNGDDFALDRVEVPLTSSKRRL